jgi:hypothetical protein
MIITDMGNPRRRASASELLREALLRAGSIRAVARDSGLQHASLIRFLRGQSLRLDLAERLLDYFELEVRPKRPKRPKRRKGR